MGVFECTQSQAYKFSGGRLDLTPHRNSMYNHVRGDTATYSWPYSPSPTSFIGLMRAATGMPLDLPRLKALKEPCDVEIVSDSKYVCEAINSWLENWIKKDFKNVKNEELWLSYIQTSKIHKIQAKWIKGHNGHIENERCDKIAKEEALILKDSIKGIK